VGEDSSTSWTDVTTGSVTNRFYKTVRIPPNVGYNADPIPSGWAVNHGLNAIEFNLDSNDPDGDCLMNLQEYLRDTDPLSPGSLPIMIGTIFAGATTNLAYVVPAMAPVYSFGYGPPLGVIQSSIDSDFYGIAHANGDTEIVFRISPQGEVTTLYTFPDTPAGGDYPRIPMQGSDGSFYGVCYLGGKTNPSVCNSTVIGYGTVFRLSPQGVLTNLHLFAGPPEGSCPVGGLVQGVDGSLYGVTEVGGSNNCLDSYCCDNGYGGYGTVFKLTPQGTLTTLHIFSGGADGAFPEAKLLLASDGYLYGTTYGGNENAGTVFKIGTDGATFATLHEFTGGADGSTPLTALVQDNAGDLYGATFGGGANGFGTLFKITTNGTLTTLHSFGGSPDGSYPGTALVQGNDGNLYGTTVFGGSGAGTVFKITPQGTLTTIAHFSGGAGGGNPDYGALVQSSLDGFFYGTTLNGGVYGGGTVFKSGVPSTYVWSVSGGTLVAGQGSSYVTLTAASICPVSLSVTATNDSGCSNSGSVTITPTAPFPSANSPIVLGETLELSIPTVAGVTYKWTGPNAFTSTNQNSIITDVQPWNAGQYCVSVIGNGCTSLASCVSVTVVTPQPTNNGPLCASQTLDLSVPTVAGATYSWTGPAGFTSTNQSPPISDVTTNNSGMYCVAATVNGCTAATNCTSVIVKPLPVAVVSNAPALICLFDGQATIWASLGGKSPWTVTWSDGVTQSNVTTNLISRIVSPSTTTVYTVTSISDANCSRGIVSGSTTVAFNTNGTSSVVVSNEVLVIYNSTTNFPDSLACKDYYINHRPGFSNANVLACNLTTYGVDGFEKITEANLTNQIINPIVNFIQTNTNKSIHYVVLMYGMPSRVEDGCDGCTYPPSVQHRISRCLRPPVVLPGGILDRSGGVYEDSNCPFVATNYPGTTCLVTALNMSTLADCEAYVDKVASMYTGDVIISAAEGGYADNTYHLDGTIPVFGGFSYACPTYIADAILAQNPNASIVCSSNTVISTGTNLRGYYGRGVNNGIFGNTYATDGTVVWSGSSTWWIIETAESFNGRRSCGQGCIKRWFASNAWGGTNYVNTPVGAVSHVEEPGGAGINRAGAYMSMWEMGFLFSECAWATRNTPCFQAVGDPLVKK
jgi:uncharacterized repeat protein (TIGR03803 family)